MTTTKSKRTRKAKGDGTGLPKASATVVSGLGTDDEIRARCAAEVPGWETMTPETQAEIVGLMRRFETLTDGPHFDVSREEGKLLVSPRSKGKRDGTLTMLRLSDAMASQDADLLDVRIADLINYHQKANGGGTSSKLLNADLAFIRGGGAEDSVQSALLVQMAATHDAAMRSLAAIGSSQFIDQMNTLGNISAKLLNVFARQAETLAKLQRGGVQEVRHVHINNQGGQAVITDKVTIGARANVEVEEQPYGQGALGTAMLGYDAAGNGLPIASDQGSQALPSPRGSGGVGRAAR